MKTLTKAGIGLAAGGAAYALLQNRRHAFFGVGAFLPERRDLIYKLREQGLA
jgi:hypothetical protein